MRALLCIVAACLSLAGCVSASAPPTRLHSLLSASSPSVRDAGAPPLVLDLAGVSLPAAVDQAPWVLRLPDDSLRILEQEQWVSPLRDELRAAIFERLALRFGAVDVRNAPGQKAWRVRIEVQRFESLPGKEAWLDSVWAATSMDDAGTTLSCRSSLRESAVGGLSALAAAHRRAALQLADQIGTQLQRLARGEAGHCPP